MKHIYIFLVATFVLLLATGCSSPPKHLTLIAHDSFVMSDELISSFEKQSGYQLQIVRAGDAGAMTNKIVLTKDSPIADVVFGIDNTFAPVAISNGVIAGDLKPIDFADVCFNVDLNYFHEHNLEIPNDWRKLTADKYRGLTVIENPNTSSTGLAFLAASYAGFSNETASTLKTHDWWVKLRSNSVKIAGSWEDAYYTDFSGSSGKGKYPIVLSYSSSPADEVDSAGNPKTKAILQDCFRQTEYAAVLANSTNTVAANQLIKFMQDEDFQRALPEAMYVYPIQKGIALPKHWAEYAPAAKTVIGDNLDISGQREKWLADFNRIFDLAP